MSVVAGDEDHIIFDDWLCRVDVVLGLPGITPYQFSSSGVDPSDGQPIQYDVLFNIINGSDDRRRITGLIFAATFPDHLTGLLVERDYGSGTARTNNQLLAVNHWR